MISLHEDHWVNRGIIHSALARISQKWCYVLLNTSYQEARDGVLSYTEDADFDPLTKVVFARFLQGEIAFFSP